MLHFTQSKVKVIYRYLKLINKLIVEYNHRVVRVPALLLLCTLSAENEAKDFLNEAAFTHLVTYFGQSVRHELHREGRLWMLHPHVREDGHVGQRRNRNALTLLLWKALDTRRNPGRAVHRAGLPFGRLLSTQTGCAIYLSRYLACKWTSKKYFVLAI